MKNPFKGKGLSKDEITRQMALKQEADKGKAIVRDVLFPILQQHATTISNAERQVEVFKTVIMLAQQKPYVNKTIGDLDFSEELENDDEKSRPVFQAFIDGFKEVKIGDAVKILNEFGGGIDAYFSAESHKREFKTLTLEDLIGK